MIPRDLIDPANVGFGDRAICQRLDVVIELLTSIAAERRLNQAPKPELVVTDRMIQEAYTAFLGVSALDGLFQRFRAALLAALKVMHE